MLATAGRQPTTAHFFGQIGADSAFGATDVLTNIPRAVRITAT